MLLNKENYFSKEANAEYWSVSQFKAFNRCEAAGLAEARGIYEREETDALLIGSYVDAYFSGELEYSPNGTTTKCIANEAADSWRNSHTRRISSVGSSRIR